MSTTSYPFMVLLNVLVFAVAGMLGLAFLLQTLNRLTASQQLPPRPAPPFREPDNPAEGDSSEPSPRDPSPLDQVPGYVLGRHVKKVFGIWVVVFGIVGAQMGWVLRPFIGDPNLPFEVFRARESNFFEAVWNSVRALFG